MKNDTLTVMISRSEYDALKSENEMLKSDVAELTAKVNWLMEQFRLAKHRQFGSSSEKSEYDQIDFFNETEKTADVNILEPELTEIEKHYRKKKRLAKDRLPEDLPVETVVHELSPEECDCSECGGRLHVMGHNVREELKLVPAKAVIVKHIQNVYACRNCERNECGVPIVKAALDMSVAGRTLGVSLTRLLKACRRKSVKAPILSSVKDFATSCSLLSEI